MGLRDELQADIAEAFDTDLADAVSQFRCSKIIYSGEMDFETQEYPVIGNQSYSGRGVFGSYKRDLVKPIDYQVEDVKATVLQNEVGQEPQIDDVWTTDKGDFEVKSISQDPTEGIWVCHLRYVKFI